MQPRPYTNNEQIGRHEQEQTRMDTKRRTSISVKEKTTYNTRRIKSTAISDNTTDHQS